VQELLKEVGFIQGIVTTGNTQYNDLYEYVQVRCSEDQKKNLSRKKAKDLVLQHYFNGKYPNQKLSFWVRTLFPNITKYIDSCNADAANRMCIRLMISESKVLHNHIMKRIATDYPESVAYAVHDSILVDSDHFNQLNDIMVEESIKYFGFEPKLEGKDLDTVPDIGYKMHLLYAS
jgi:hypothetical protein